MSKINVSTITNRTGTSGPVLSGVTTATNGFHVTGGSVGIGTDDPTNYGGSVKLAVHSSGNSVLSIAAGTNSDSSILFADGTSGDATYRGNIKYAHNGDSMRFHTAAGERLRITSAGNVGVGITNPSDALTVHKINIGNPTGITIRNTEPTSTYSHARLRLESQNGAAYGEIWADVANAGLRLGYNSSSTVKIDTNGNIVFGNGKGIDFSATGNGSGTMTSELLDDYEEGTWTPTTTNFTHTVDATECRYTKIGRMVYLTGQITRSQASTPAADIVVITGLPYAQSSPTRSIQGSYWLDNLTTAGDYMGGMSYSNTTSQIIFAQASTPTHTASSRYIEGNDFDNNRGMLFSLVYITD